MRDFLVVGLESSCTRHVSIMIASNLGMDPNWDGTEEISDGNFKVVHRSLPHGPRDNFIKKDYWMVFDTVVLCTRDTNCSLISKMHHHQANPKLARMEQDRGKVVMSEIFSTHPRVHIHSYESSYVLGRKYNEVFFAKLGVPYSVHFHTEEINSKYFPKIMF